MFQFPGFAPPIKIGGDRSSTGRVAPFGNLRINSYVHLPAAYRSLSRPSSPLIAKASTVYSYVTYDFLVFFSMKIVSLYLTYIHSIFVIINHRLLTFYLFVCFLLLIISQYVNELFLSIMLNF